MAESDQLLTTPELERLADTFRSWPGAQARATTDVRRAAVALVLRNGAAGLELLFIQRSVYAGDPWSGQVAFPGGRAEPEDLSLRDTAVRETREELGLELERDGVVIGVLDELHPQTPLLPPIVVRPYVAVVHPTVQPVLSAEVAQTFWVSLDELCSPAATTEAEVDVRGTSRLVPCLRHDQYVIWGMTERIFRDFQLRLNRAGIG